MVKGTQKSLTVKWILPDKRVVKFKEEEDTYDLADNVKTEYLTGIDAGVAVKVTINEGKVIFMQKDKENKLSSVKDNKPESNEERMTCTINAMTTDKSVVKFEKDKDNKKWYIITDAVKADFEKLNKGDIVDVTLGKVLGYNKAKTKKFPKDAVIAVHSDITSDDIKVDLSEIKGYDDSLKKSYSAQYSYNGKNDSIERQCALKSATELVVALIEQDKIDSTNPEKVKNILTSLTKSCYEAIQKA